MIIIINPIRDTWYELWAKLWDTKSRLCRLKVARYDIRTEVWLYSVEPHSTMIDFSCHGWDSYRTCHLQDLSNQLASSCHMSLRRWNRFHPPLVMATIKILNINLSGIIVDQCASFRSNFDPSLFSLDNTFNGLFTYPDNWPFETLL